MRTGGRWGFIDKAGKIVINPQFDDAMSFTNGMSRVRLSGKTGYIGPDGKYIWNPAD